MNTWSDGLLRSMQFWLLWLGVGLPLLGALAGGFCALVKVRADHEITRRQDVARATQIENDRRQRDNAESELRAKVDRFSRLAADLALQNGRRITADERTKFIDNLEFSPKGKVRVHINQGVDAETVAFANQMQELLAAAGYDTGAAVEVGTEGKIPQGVFMSVGHGQHPFAGAIQQALGLIGVSATGLIDHSLQGDEVRVDVGTKP